MASIFIAVIAWGVANEAPAKVLDLSQWKLTIPIDNDADGRADEVSQSQLPSFHDPRYFFVHDSAVVFRCPCDGATTKGSQYPRCELREMSGTGKGTLAAWHTNDMGVHRMTAKMAITQTPVVKKHVVCAQIHDANDDVLMVRLEGKKLFIERNSEMAVVLTPNYQLGTPFELKIEAGDGRIRVWHNAEPKLDWKVARQNCYFKAGCYTQSNTDKGDAAEACGVVAIYHLRVEHNLPR